MKITKQEKVNLCFFFLSAFEKMDECIEKYYMNIIDEIYHDKKSPVGAVLRSKYKKENLKQKDKFEILMDIGVLTVEENKKISELADLRNDIGHESGRIYFDESIELESFKLEEMISLFKIIIAKICNVALESCCATGSRPNEILKLYLKNVMGLKIMFDDLLKDKKFDTLRELIIDKLEIK